MGLAVGQFTIGTEHDTCVTCSVTLKMPNLKLLYHVVQSILKLSLTADHCWHLIVVQKD